MAEQKGQNDPNEAAPEEIKTQRDRPDFQPRPNSRTYAKWKGGGFLVSVIFSYAFHNLRLFFMP